MLLPSTLLAAALTNVSVTAPVEAELLIITPSPVNELTPPPPEIVLHPNPVPEVHISALVAPLHDGTDKPEGVVAVSAPST